MIGSKLLSRLVCRELSHYPPVTNDIDVT